jgi:hypothetical protein
MLLINSRGCFMPKKCLYLDDKSLKVITHRANKLGLNFSEYTRRLVKNGLELEISQNQISQIDRYILKTTLETLMLCRHLLPAKDEAVIQTFSQKAKELTSQLINETHQQAS